MRKVNLKKLIKVKKWLEVEILQNKILLVNINE